MILERVVAAVVAAALPMLLQKWDETVPVVLDRLEPVVRDVLAEKLDELVPDVIDKQMPLLLNGLADEFNKALKGILGGGLFR